MALIAANPDALGNIRNGREAFAKGLRSPADVLRAHLGWNRGTAADKHFCDGFWEAAEAAGEPRGTVREALRYLPIWRGAVPLAPGGSRRLAPTPPPPRRLK